MNGKNWSLKRHYSMIENEMETIKITNCITTDAIANTSSINSSNARAISINNETKINTHIISKDIISTKIGDKLNKNFNYKNKYKFGNRLNQFTLNCMRLDEIVNKTELTKLSSTKTSTIQNQNQNTLKQNEAIIFSLILKNKFSTLKLPTSRTKSTTNYSLFPMKFQSNQTILLAFKKQLINFIGIKNWFEHWFLNILTRTMFISFNTILLTLFCFWLSTNMPACHCDKLMRGQQLMQSSLPFSHPNYHTIYSKYHHRRPISRSVSMHSNSGSLTNGQSGVAHLPPLTLSPQTAYKTVPMMVYYGNSGPGSASGHLPVYPTGAAAFSAGSPSAIGSVHRNHEDCEINTDPVIELLLDKMRQNLPEEKITVQNGAITIFDARIVRFAELSRIRSSCAQKLDPEGIQLLLPFEAEIRLAHVAAKLKYNFYVTDLYGDYTGNFSHIRLNGTLEANLEEEWMQVSQFNITSSQVIDDSIVFNYVPRWILEWVRSYFDNDNTQMYEQLAKVILQKEANNFLHYDLIRHIAQSAMFVEARDEEDRIPPLNRL